MPDSIEKKNETDIYVRMEETNGQMDGLRESWRRTQTQTPYLLGYYMIPRDRSMVLVSVENEIIRRQGFSIQHSQGIIESALSQP